MLVVRKMYDWCGQQVRSSYAVPLLALLFFIEAIFFLPVDPLLIVYCLEDRCKALYFATVATLSSVIGGITGYFIGYAIWESCGKFLVGLLFSPQTFAHALHNYEKYESWAVLIAGFTPLPYKAVTLSAGFCKLPLLPFVIFSLLGRGARFFLIAISIRIWGHHIKEYIDRYFNSLLLLFTLMVVAACWWCFRH
jgi:membrane protein YqaA with SNARE-associated domain